MTATAHAHELATALILVSALLHAAVNTLVKVSGDGLITRGCMNAVACVAAAPFLLVVPPPSEDLWVLLLASVLVHALYPFFLVAAYARGDLSAVFPLARGAVPLLVTPFAYMALAQDPGPAALAGIAVVSLSVASFAVGPSAGPGRPGARGVLYAFATSLIVAVYTLIDAVGLRLAPTPFSYIAWLFVLDGIAVALLVVAARGRAVSRHVARYWRSGIVAGVLGVLTYACALLALSLGTVAEVAALRETSIVFAALIGACVLKEPLGKTRMATATVMLGGIVLMHVGR